MVPKVRQRFWNLCDKFFRDRNKKKKIQVNSRCQGKKLKFIKKRKLSTFVFNFYLAVPNPKRCRTYLENISMTHILSMFLQTNKWICSTQLSHNLFPSVELFTEIISSISYGRLQSELAFIIWLFPFPLLMALKTYLRPFSITNRWLAALDPRTRELNSKLRFHIQLLLIKLSLERSIARISFAVISQ